MQWLSRIYGGRGGYTSEELYKIITGKEPKGGGYYIFPFVKGAPPEVNRILERTYREHRKRGDDKTASAIAAWTKVRQAGYVKVTKPRSAWVKRRYVMEPVATVRYGVLESVAGKAAKVIKKHPKATRATSLVSLGVLAGRALEKKPRVRKYQIPPRWNIGMQPKVISPTFKSRLLKSGTVAGKVGKRVGRAAGRTAGAFVLAMLVDRILERIERRAGAHPLVPKIQTDIELARGMQLKGYVIQYTARIPTQHLQAVQGRITAALHKAKVGAEKGLLAWLLGFISAELLARGITTPKQKHQVTFPQAEGYAFWQKKKKKKPIPELRKLIRRRPLTMATIAGLAGGGVVAQPLLRELRRRNRIIRVLAQKGFEMNQTAVQYVKPLTKGERLPGGFQPFTPPSSGKRYRPKKWGKYIPPGAKPPASHRLLKLTPAVALAATAILARRKAMERLGYSWGSAATKTMRGVKRLGGGLGRGLSTATNIAIPALIISEFIPKKKKSLQPPVPTTPTTIKRTYMLPESARVKLALGLLPKYLTRLRKVPMAARHASEIGVAQAQLALTRTRMKQALRAKLGRPWKWDVKSKQWRYQSPGRVKWGALEPLAQAAGEFKGGFKHPRIVGVGRAIGMKSTVAESAGAFVRKHPGTVAGVGLGLLGLRELRKMRKQRAKRKFALVSVEVIEEYPMRSQAQRRWMHATHPKMAEEWEKETPEGAKLPEKVKKHPKAKSKEKAQKHSAQYAFRVPWAAARLRDLLRLKGSSAQGREVALWARKIANTLRAKQMKATGAKAAATLAARASNWETVAAQVEDALGRAQLEKIGLVAAVGGAAAAGHVAGRKREKERIRKLI